MSGAMKNPNKPIWRHAVAKLDNGTKDMGIWLQSVARLNEANGLAILQQLVAEMPRGHNLRPDRFKRECSRPVAKYNRLILEAA